MKTQFEGLKAWALDVLDVTLTVERVGTKGVKVYWFADSTGKSLGCVCELRHIEVFLRGYQAALKVAARQLVPIVR